MRRPPAHLFGPLPDLGFGPALPPRQLLEAARDALLALEIEIILREGVDPRPEVWSLLGLSRALRDATERELETLGTLRETATLDLLYND